MKYYNSILELIGKTPLVRLNNIKVKEDLYSNIYAKVEFFNPGGSVKDRVAAAMIRAAEKSGALTTKTTIYEPTSGNTGIGAALIGAAKGYKVIIVMPDTVSIERIKLIKAYGAEVILTSGKEGMLGSIAKVKELMEKDKGSITLSQFENKENPFAHYQKTGQEIYADLDGQVDVLVSAVGTGGTISGAGKYLKEQNKNIEIVAVEPEASPVLSKGIAGPHKIQGIGAGFVPKTLDTSIYDQIIVVSEEEAIKNTRLLAENEGILCGISSGAALYAAIELAKDIKYKDKNIVVILPDTGERYLSTEVFAA